MERDPSSVSKDEVPFSYRNSAVAAFACHPGQLLFYDDVIEVKGEIPARGDVCTQVYCYINQACMAVEHFDVMSSASRIQRKSGNSCHVGVH